MKRSTNFNGMKRYRDLGLEDFVLTCKKFGMTKEEIIEAVKGLQGPKATTDSPKLQAKN